MTAVGWIVAFVAALVAAVQWWRGPVAPGARIAGGDGDGLLASGLLTSGLRAAHMSRLAAKLQWPRDGPGEAEPQELAADVELLALCCEAGLPMRTAVESVARTAGESTRELWARVAQLLTVGVAPNRAFADCSGLAGFDEVARIVSRSVRSGSAMADSFRDLARRLRDAGTEAAIARAERAGVLIALPLSGCFLPAFVALGLVPIVLSLGSQILAH